LSRAALAEKALRVHSYDAARFCHPLIFSYGKRG
jgi:hypothetical protein